MHKVPRNDGAFDKQIEEWKNLYLKKNSEGITEEAIEEKRQARRNARRSSWEDFFNIPNSRERMKQEYCRLEAKRVRLLLDGRTEEAEKLAKKLMEKKKLYKRSFCKKD